MNGRNVDYTICMHGYAWPAKGCLECGAGWAPDHDFELAGDRDVCRICSCPRFEHHRESKRKGPPRPTTMTERQVQFILWRQISSAAQIVVPNYTPAGWWECDLWAMTKAGYWSEHEIKLTRSDYFADRNKVAEGWKRGAGWELEGKRKHDLLAARDPRGPSRFWYVVPDGMITREEVPSWAGLKYIQGRFAHLAKDAPQLHRKKADRKIIHKAYIATYWRYWGSLA